MSPSCDMEQPGEPVGWGLESWAKPWGTVPGSSTRGILNVAICLFPWAEPYTDQEPQALPMTFGNIIVLCVPSAGALGLSSPDWGWAE